MQKYVGAVVDVCGSGGDFLLRFHSSVSFVIINLIITIPQFSPCILKFHNYIKDHLEYAVF
jgi:hypothetical protein